MPQRTDANQIVYWLLGALLVTLMAIIGITHSMVMNQFSSIERRLERIENKTMDMPFHR